MRELEDYFCTYEQENELIQIGYTANFVSLFQGLQQTENFTSGILRSQALDYFMELGWHGYVKDYTADRYVYCINRVTKDAFGFKGIKHLDVVTYSDFKNSHEDFNIVELNLIDKLIELEKEARNENK